MRLKHLQIMYTLLLAGRDNILNVGEMTKNVWKTGRGQ